MNLRIASAVYALPAESEAVASVLAREKERVEAALRPLDVKRRARLVEGLGIERVRVCRQEQPYDLALKAATTALAEAGVPPRNVDLIIDFSTLPGDGDEYVSFAHRLSVDLGAETSLNLSYKLGGCAGLHLALKAASALMAADQELRTAVLVCADAPPAGSRSLFPVSVQSDAASAVVLRQGGEQGPVWLQTEVLTLGHLHDVIRLRRNPRLTIEVDSLRVENEVMPCYYLNFHRLITRVLEKASLSLDQIDHFIYSNLSRTDQEGFLRAFEIPAEKVYRARLADCGHTFASDLVVNYSDLNQAARIRPGQFLLFASAGIGFTWGVSLAKA